MRCAELYNVFSKWSFAQVSESVATATNVSNNNHIENCMDDEYFSFKTVLHENSPSFDND